MNTISYLIVEDELKSRETLLKKIDICDFQDLTCVGLAANADEALWLIKKNRPEIILLDINLPGKNGFDILESIELENYFPELIFTSAYNQNDFLLKALKTGPVSYLLKPIDIDELKSSIEKAVSRVNLRKNQVLLSGKIKLIGIREVLFLKPDQISFCRADGHYSNLYLINGKIELICQSIGSIEKLLPANKFFRIDRSSLVNISMVESIDMKKQTCLLCHLDYSMSIEMSVIGLKRLMTKLEQ